MYLSVIIPTRNRGKELSIALGSLAKQTLSPDEFEVIVVDNGSTDNTRDVVRSYQGEIKNLRCFYDNVPGLHVGRNRGLKEAMADILVYADDDIEAFPVWLEGIKESFALDKNIGLVGGKNLPAFETEPPEWLLKMWNKNTKVGKILGYLSLIDLGEEIKEINPFFVFGCNFAIKKQVLIEAGGFHPDGMPQKLIKYRGDGESYISSCILEKGYMTLYNPKASVYHFVPEKRMTLEYFCIRAFNEGISSSYVQIRKNHIKTPVKKRNINNESIITIAKTVKGKLLFIINLINVKLNKFKKDIFYEIHNEINKAYKAGYRYHQNEVKNDPKLLEWVLLENYLG